MSQWAWLHSLKDARHGPEVSSTALLQLKGGQGTKPAGDSERSRQWESTGLMNEVLYQLGSSKYWDDTWFGISTAPFALWWLILSINIHHMELESWYYDATLVPLTKMTRSIRASLELWSWMCAVEHWPHHPHPFDTGHNGKALQADGLRWLKQLATVRIVWFDAFDCFIGSFCRFWTPLTSWNQFLWPSPTWNWRETPWKPQTWPKLLGSYQLVSSGYQLTGNIVGV